MAREDGALVLVVVLLSVLLGAAMMRCYDKHSCFLRRSVPTSEPLVRNQVVSASTSVGSNEGTTSGTRPM